MSSKEKAKELVDKFIPNVYCHLGSGMLTNTYDDDVALINAKKQAKICVDEILKSKSKPNTNYTIEVLEDIEYWREVLTEIDKL